MANFNFNKVMMGGRMVADPEIKQTQSGVAVCTFSIAVNRYVKQGEQPQADFFNVTAWRNTAEFVSKYFKKGSSIFVVGKLQNRSWTDQNGQKRFATDISADEVSFVDGKNDAPGANDGGGAYIPDAYKQADAANYEQLDPDDSLPF